MFQLGYHGGRILSIYRVLYFKLHTSFVSYISNSRSHFSLFSLIGLAHFACIFRIVLWKKKINKVINNIKCPTIWVKVAYRLYGFFSHETWMDNALNFKINL